MLLVALLVLAADITSKILVVANLSEEQKIPLIPGVLALRGVRIEGTRVERPPRGTGAPDGGSR